MRLQSIVRFDINDKSFVDVDINAIKSIAYFLHDDDTPTSARIFLLGGGDDGPLTFGGYFAYAIWRFVTNYDDLRPGSFLRRVPWADDNGLRSQFDIFMGSIASAQYSGRDDDGRPTRVEFTYVDGDNGRIDGAQGVAEFSGLMAAGFTLPEWEGIRTSDRARDERRRYETIYPAATPRPIPDPGPAPIPPLDPEYPARAGGYPG
jgi:hypothetical protein